MQVTAQGMSQTLVKYGNTCKDLDDHDPIGQPMGPITKELRAAGNGVEGLKKERETLCHGHEYSADGRLEDRPRSFHGITQLEIT